MASIEDRVEKINKQKDEGSITPEQHADLYKKIMESGDRAATGDPIADAVLDRFEQDSLQKIQEWRLHQKNRRQQIAEVLQTPASEVEDTTAERAKSGKLDPHDAMVMGYVESARRAPNKETSDEIMLGMQALFIQYPDPTERRAIYNWAVLENYGATSVNRHGKLVEALSRFTNGVLHAKSTNPKTASKYQELNETTCSEFADFQANVEGAGSGAEPRFMPSTFAKIKDSFRQAKPAKIPGLEGGGTIPLIETPNGWCAKTDEVEHALNGHQKKIRQLEQEIANLKKQNQRNRNFDHGYSDRGGRGRGRGRGRARGTYGGSDQQQQHDAEGQPPTETRRPPYFQ